MTDSQLTTDEKRRIIWQTLAAVPAGKVVTYGQLATMSGLPGYARFVGATLKRLPSDTQLPWFRVINAAGRISFPIGSPAFLRQRLLLEEDDVCINQGRIDLKRYQWRPKFQLNGH